MLTRMAEALRQDFAAYVAFAVIFTLACYL
jgi:hypothetical protein